METLKTDNNALVQIENLSRRYGETTVVNNLKFNLDRGEVLGFLGPNGAGKSTSMQMITGNLAPSHGQIIINGFDMIDEPIKAKACIGYLPENPPLYRELTVDEYLTYCAKLHNLSGIKLNESLDLAKQQCGLLDVGSRLIGNLSKGYQQRVGIAQAIIHQPPVVILDEPTVGLDPIQIMEIRKLIKGLGKERSVILSTHILPEVQATCDRVQIIRQGDLIYNSSIDDLNLLGQGDSLVVAFNNPPDIPKISTISGVQKVIVLDPNRFQLQVEDDSIAEQIVQQSVAENWGLFELIPDNSSLEQIFVELTTAEPVADEEVQAA